MLCICFLLFRLLFASADEGCGIHGDHQLFVGGDEQDLDLGIRGGDHALLAADVVGVLVHLHAHVLQAGRDLHTLERVVLADTGGEDDGVHAAMTAAYAPMSFLTS